MNPDMSRFPKTLSECADFRRQLWEQLEENPGMEVREPAERITADERRRNFERNGDVTSAGR
jgi:hypothetical protein